MIQTLDSTGFRVIGYLVVVGVALVAWYRERREVKLNGAAYWPLFCAISAVLVFALFVIRWRDFDDNLANFGRDQAFVDGWYNSSRRIVQAAVILGIAALWSVLAIVTIWRVPGRRRRYLPAAILLFSMFAFDAIRAVSFHDVDTLLYRQSILGFRLITFVEMGGQVAMAVALLWHPFVERPAAVDEPGQPSTAGVGGR